MDEPLLFRLFAHIRKAGLPLGIDDYLLLLSTLRAGHGLENPDSLRLICRLVWAKSPEDQQVIDEAYDMFVSPRLQLQPELGDEELASDRSSSGLDDRPPALPPVPSPPASHAEETLESGAMPLHSPVVNHDPRAPKTLGTYQMTPRLPMARREMSRIWRSFRRLQHQGPPVDLDIEATIKAICYQGSLLLPILQPRRRNQVRLLTLVDCASEMAPFALLIDALIDSIYRGGFGRAEIFYYYECPQDTLFARPGHLGAHLTSAILAEHARAGSVLFISAAGAACRWRSFEQAQCIQSFLRLLRAETYRYAWLNPLPPQRWHGTTAGDIARMVPMFPIDRNGLIDAVSILRGHPFPPGVNLNAEWS